MAQMSHPLPVEVTYRIRDSLYTFQPLEPKQFIQRFKKQDHSREVVAPLVQGLSGQRHVNLSEFGTTLVYIASSRPVGDA